MKITMIIDCSGSMSGKDKEFTAGIRKIVKDNKSAKFNLVEFESSVEIVAEDMPGKRWKLSRYTLKPRGMTAMYDGIGEGLSLIDLDEKNLIVIVTDGLENASSEWNSKQVKLLLEAYQKAGAEVLFMGAGMDAFKASDDLGIVYGNTIQLKENDAKSFSDGLGVVQGTVAGFTAGLRASDALVITREKSDYSDTLAFRAPSEKAERRKGKQFKPNNK